MQRQENGTEIDPSLSGTPKSVSLRSHLRTAQIFTELMSGHI